MGFATPGMAELPDKLSNSQCGNPQGFSIGRLTVGFLYGAGAETLKFVTRTSEKIPENFRVPTEKPKSAVDTQKTNKNRCLGIRC